MGKLQIRQYLIHHPLRHAQRFEIGLGQELIPSNPGGDSPPIEEGLEDGWVDKWVNKHGEDEATEYVKIFVWVEWDDVAICRSGEGHTGDVIRVGVLYPEVGGVDVLVGVGAEYPQLTGLVPAGVVHEHIDVEVEWANYMTQRRQYQKVLTNLIQQRHSKRLDYVLFK